VQCRQKTSTPVVPACVRTWPRYSSSAVATDGTGYMFGDNHPLRMTEKTQMLADGILKRDRRSLSRAITLVESHKKEHSKQAELLIDYVLSRRRGQAMRKKDQDLLSTFRLGIAGPPGAGKSTFIEALGLMLIERGHRVAVVAVDPSSKRTGGSILGDKTRMTYLSRTLDAFVRPSPSSGILGGLAEHTNDVILLCESAGFDIVLIETVGLGQSEVAVDDAADMCLLLLPPAGGDDLQGVKKGIMEIADLVVINKADGELKTAAQHATASVRHALQLIRPRSLNWTPKVMRCSSLFNSGIDKVWDKVDEYRRTMLESGELGNKRKEQNHSWMLRQFHEQIMREARRHPSLQKTMTQIDSALVGGYVTPRRAAGELLKQFLEDKE
jgi:LAO/AO transport system kinase